MAARPLRYEPTPDVPDEIRYRVSGERTIEDLQRAQKALLSAARPPVHPTVWAEALKAADGDIRRIAVHSPTEVYVMNNPDQKPRWLVEEDD